MGSKGSRKICALGVKASRWVTIARPGQLMLNTNQAIFNHIVPCGIRGQGGVALHGNEEVTWAPPGRWTGKESALKNMASLFGAVRPLEGIIPA